MSTLLCGAFIPINCAVAVFQGANPTPIPVRKSHLCTFITSISGKRVIKLCLCLIDVDDSLVTCGVEECEEGLR